MAVSAKRATLPPVLAELIMRCLAKRPADRPQSAEELLPVLEGLATPSGGITPAQTQPVAAVRVTTPRPRWLVPAAAVAVIGVVAVGAVLMRGNEGPTATAGDVRAPVVVVPFEVRATDPGLKDLSAQAADQLTAASEQAGIGAVVPYRVTGESEAFSPELARRVVKATGAATLVTGVIAQRGDSVEVQAKVVRGWDVRVICSLGPGRVERGGGRAGVRLLKRNYSTNVLGSVSA